MVNLLKDAWKERLAEEQVRPHQPSWPGVASRVLRGGPLEVPGSRVEGHPTVGGPTKQFSPTLQKEKFSDFFFGFLERRFGTADAMAWAYTVFENIKLFRSSEIMSQFYAILMEKVSLGLAPHPFPQDRVSSVSTAPRRNQSVIAPATPTDE